MKALALLVLWPALLLGQPAWTDFGLGLSDSAGIVSASKSNGDPYLDKYLGNAARLRAEGNLAAARAAVEKALERDDRHLDALQALAERVQQVQLAHLVLQLLTGL